MIAIINTVKEDFKFWKLNNELKEGQFLLRLKIKNL